MQKSVHAGAAGAVSAVPSVAFPVLLGLSFAHLLNDMMQSLVPAIYPVIKDAYHLDFGQIGLITFAFQLTACIFQPWSASIPTSTRNPIRRCSAWASR